MQAVKDTYNDDTSNISGNVILLKIQTQLKNIKSFYHVSYIYAKMCCKVLWNHTTDTYIIKAIDTIIYYYEAENSTLFDIFQLKSIPKSIVTI